MNCKKVFYALFFGIFICWEVFPLRAQVVLNDISTAYTQNFNSITGVATAGVKTWTDSSIITGWYGMTVGASTQYYRATNGASMTPTNTAATPTSLLTLRSTGSEAALGSVSNSTYYAVFGVQFSNNTGSTINSLTITYTGEQWAWNTGAANTLNFSYSTDATSLTSGTWVDNDSLDFTALYSGNSTNQGLNGNADTIFVSSSYVAKSSGEAGGSGALNYTTITAMITGLSIENGETLWLRWSDSATTSGVGQTLAIDDLAVSFVAIPEPSDKWLLLMALSVWVLVSSHRYKGRKIMA